MPLIRQRRGSNTVDSSLLNNELGPTKECSMKRLKIECRSLENEENESISNGNENEPQKGRRQSQRIVGRRYETLNLNEMFKDPMISRTVKRTSRSENSSSRKPKSPKLSPVLTKSSRKSTKNVSEEESSSPDIYSPTKKLKGLSLNDKCATPSLRTSSRNIFGTPKRTPMSKRLIMANLTPSMQNRSQSIVKPSTPLQATRMRLHVGVLPKSLPCREKEFNDVYLFLQGKLEDHTGGCMYVSGVPGTGKTATINEVIRCFQKLVENGDYGPFDFVEINGMKLSDPRQAYNQIWKKLSGQTVSSEAARQLLQKRFTSKSKAKKGLTLLLIDELDQLSTKRQDVVYNLLDWPTNANSHLVVITIANTMDLPERILKGKVTSRLGLTRLTFQPYNYLQLQEILLYRMKDSISFKSKAVELAARKVASVSGDARRALDICRRAADIAEQSGEDTVSMNHMNQSLEEMIASPKILAIKHCSELEKIFLKAVSAEVTRTGVDEVIFKYVYEKMLGCCAIERIQVPNETTALMVCARLAAWGLISCDNPRADILQKILLNVSSDDIMFALQKNPST